MSIQTLAFSCAALGLAALSALGAPGQERAVAQKEETVQEVPRLTIRQKLQKMHTIPTGVNQAPTTIIDSFTLTVNHPIIKEKAAVSFFNFDRVCPRLGYVGYAMSIDDKVANSSGQHAFPYVSLDFKVSQPNKTHVATFYFWSAGFEVLEFYVDGKSVQLVKYEPGAVQAMVAFKPTKTGHVRVDMKGDSRGFRMKLNFTGVDMDVVQ